MLFHWVALCHMSSSTAVPGAAAQWAPGSPWHPACSHRVLKGPVQVCCRYWQPCGNTQFCKLSPPPKKSKYDARYTIHYNTLVTS